MNPVTDTAARWREAVVGRLSGGGLGKGLAVLLGLYLIVAVVAGMYWSIAPAPLDVRDRARALAADEGGDVVTGSVTTGALISVIEVLLEKPGGYVHNDRFPPGLWLDNMPNWWDPLESTCRHASLSIL